MCPFCTKKSNTLLKILFQNVRSLHLHFKDVACDYSVKASDISIFVETALCNRDHDDDYALQGFQIFRNDYNASSALRSPYGSVLYVKNDLDCVYRSFRYNYNDVEITVCILNKPVNHLHVVGIYRSKSKVTVKNLLEVLNYLHNSILKEVPGAIFGDFNVDLLVASSEQKALIRNFTDKGYTQLIHEYTTDYCSQIDQIH